MQKIACGLIKTYQYLISPCLKPSCRFYPTCSNYAIAAIRFHGICKGLFFSIWRLLRCHPWSAGGFDPVESISGSPYKEKS